MLNPWRDISRLETNSKLIYRIEVLATTFGVVSMLGCSLSSEHIKSAQAYLKDTTLTDNPKRFLSRFGFNIDQEKALYFKSSVVGFYIGMCSIGLSVVHLGQSMMYPSRSICKFVL